MISDQWVGNDLVFITLHASLRVNAIAELKAVTALLSGGELRVYQTGAAFIGRRALATPECGQSRGRADFHIGGGVTDLGDVEIVQ